MIEIIVIVIVYIQSLEVKSGRDDDATPKRNRKAYKLKRESIKSRTCNLRKENQKSRDMKVWHDL